MVKDTAIKLAHLISNHWDHSRSIVVIINIFGTDPECNVKDFKVMSIIFGNLMLKYEIMPLYNSSKWYLCFGPMACIFIRLLTSIYFLEFNLNFEFCTVRRGILSLWKYLYARVFFSCNVWILYISNETFFELSINHQSNLL